MVADPANKESNIGEIKQTNKQTKTGSLSNSWNSKFGIPISFAKLCVKSKKKKKKKKNWNKIKNKTN